MKFFPYDEVSGVDCHPEKKDGVIRKSYPNQ
jgi:hypothetical protein